MKTHCNYVLHFSDGSVKVGVTSRPQARVSEICCSKRGIADLVRGVRTPHCEKDSAFEIEANLCSLLKYRATDGTREWFAGGDEEFHFLRQTTGMFWQSVCNSGQSEQLAYSEVVA